MLNRHDFLQRLSINFTKRQEPTMYGSLGGWVRLGSDWDLMVMGLTTQTRVCAYCGLMREKFFVRLAPRVGGMHGSAVWSDLTRSNS